jgi:hypothetical protein
MISLKNANIKELDKINLFHTSLSPKAKESTTSSNIAVSSKVPQTTKNAEAKITFEKYIQKYKYVGGMNKSPKNEAAAIKPNSPTSKK